MKATKMPTETTEPLPSLEQVARLELGETPEVKTKALQRLRQLLEGVPSLKVPPGDDFLVMFLRARKYRVEDAFDTIQKYFRMRRDTPEFFEDLTPANVPLQRICHENHLVMISPEPDAFGRGITLVKLGAWNPTICSLNELSRAALLITGCGQLEHAPQIRGVSSIVDLTGFGSQHLALFTPSFLRKAVHITQDCWPVRIKALYFINCPKVFEVLFAVVKPLLRYKLMSRIHFIRNDDCRFWDICPPALVPEEFGGRQEQFDYVQQDEFIRSKSTFFESLCQCGYVKE